MIRGIGTAIIIAKDSYWVFGAGEDGLRLRLKSRSPLFGAAMRYILVPVDLSDVSTRVADEAARLALAMNAQVRLFYVEADEQGIFCHDAELLRERERFLSRPGGPYFALAQLAKRIREQGVEVETGHGTGNPVWRIVREAGKVSAMLIVIGSHGHGAFYRFLSGGIGERIRRLAPCPVVVVRSEPTSIDAVTEEDVPQVFVTRHDYLF